MPILIPFRSDVTDITQTHTHKHMHARTDTDTCLIRVLDGVIVPFICTYDQISIFNY